MATTEAEWVIFFEAAGVNPVNAAAYARIFHQNLMDFSVLTRLNEDGLRQMGITLMGDVYKILGHAERVNGRTTTELMAALQNLACRAIGFLVAPFYYKID